MILERLRQRKADQRTYHAVHGHPLKSAGISGRLDHLNAEHRKHGPPAGFASVRYWSDEDAYVNADYITANGSTGTYYSAGKDEMLDFPTTREDLSEVARANAEILTRCVTDP